MECSRDGVVYKQMRIFHMFEGAGEIVFGIYACSPEQSSFKAVFTDMESRAEGCVNKIKRIKHSMYGRASFLTLRTKVLLEQKWRGFN